MNLARLKIFYCFEHCYKMNPIPLLNYSSDSTVLKSTRTTICPLKNLCFLCSPPSVHGSAVSVIYIYIKANQKPAFCTKTKWRMLQKVS